MIKHAIMMAMASTVTVMGALAPTASASIRQDEPYIVIEKTTGPTGTTLFVAGGGFIPNLAISIFHPGLSGPDSTKADENGFVPAITFRVREGTPAGRYNIQYRQAGRIAQVEFQGPEWIDSHPAGYQH
ncbi:hypothetical protein [Nonomuraea polychroma]|nr:hypothetical protein [Nonomuraea polychroma]